MTVASRVPSGKLPLMAAGIGLARAEGVSADRGDHWADLIIKAIEQTVIDHRGSVQPRTPECLRTLREVIFYALDEEIKRAKQ